MQLEPSPVRVDELTTLKKSETAGGRKESVDVGQPTLVQRAQPKSPVRSPDPGPSSLLAGRYLLVPPSDGSNMHTCIDVNTREEYSCRIVDRNNSGLLEAHYRLDAETHVNSLAHVVVGMVNVYLMFGPSYGDLHSYVKARRRLREPEARRLFKQIAQAVCSCHQAGLVLRDVKLRKFVFADVNRTELKLESLEDAVVLSDESDDVLEDKRGCPAYVSPEILRSRARYSGRASDVWSLGVILYTMLVGRYPFNDAEHMTLFWKISRGHFVMPDCISPQAKCLIRSLLRREPSERLTASDVLLHPWFHTPTRCYHPSFDQIVPDSSAP